MSSLSSASKLLCDASNLFDLIPGLHELDLPLVLRTPEEVKVRHELCQNALHAACRHQLPQADVSRIMGKVPNAVKEADSNGCLPLHIACFNDSPMDVLLEIFIAFPEAISSKNKSGATPLHYFLARHEFVVGSTLEQECIFMQNMKAAREKDSNGLLPLHVACSHNVPIKVIQLLINIYPEAVAMQDNFGDTPLHFICCGNKYAHNTARHLLEADRSILDIKDSKGLRPIDTLIKNTLYFMDQYLADRNGLREEDWTNFGELIILLTEATQYQNRPLPCLGSGHVLHTLLAIDSCPSKCIRWALKRYPEQVKELGRDQNLHLHKLVDVWWCPSRLALDNSATGWSM